MQAHGLFSLLAERLMLEAKTITVTTYNVLFEVLCFFCFVMVVCLCSAICENLCGFLVEVQPIPNYV